MWWVRRSIPSPGTLGRAGLGGYLEEDRVGGDLRPGGARRTVAPRLPDHRGRFAGDGGLVDRRDPLYDGPVARDQLVHLDDDEIALAERGGGDALFAPFGADEPPRDGVRLRPAEGVGLGLSAPLGDRLGEVREEDRRPQPEDLSLIHI